MIKNDTGMTLSSYLNNITFHFYEDNNWMEELGLRFGLDVRKDYFLAMSFLYPSDTAVMYEEKIELKELLSPLTAYGPINQHINSPQFILCDKGVSLIFAAHTKDELSAAIKPACDKALLILDERLPDIFIRIGIGTIETGLNGIASTYQNSLKAINAGEKFKKERRVLDSIGMEIYSAINAMVLAYGHSLISTILLQMSEKEQLILGKYYKYKEKVSDTAAALQISEQDVLNALAQIKDKTGLDVNDTEDNFKLNFVMIAKRVLEKEKRRR